MTLTAPWSSRLVWDPAADCSVPVGSDPTRQQNCLLLAGSGHAVHDESCEGVSMRVVHVCVFACEHVKGEEKSGIELSI